MKYKIIKQGLALEGSAIGDIVEMNDKASGIALDAGVVEPYSGEEKAKHALLFVDPLKVFPTQLTVNN